MVWAYVAVGVVVLIALLILIKSESSPLRRRRSETASGLTYICMHCGHSFKGGRCTHCGSERKPIDFGR